MPSGITLDHVQSDDVDDIAQLLHENREAFAKIDIDLGFSVIIPHVQANS